MLAQRGTEFTAPPAPTGAHDMLSITFPSRPNLRALAAGTFALLGVAACGNAPEEFQRVPCDEIDVNGDGLLTDDDLDDQTFVVDLVHGGSRTCVLSSDATALGVGDTSPVLGPDGLQWEADRRGVQVVADIGNGLRFYSTMYSPEVQDPEEGPASVGNIRVLTEEWGPSYEPREDFVGQAQLTLVRDREFSGYFLSSPVRLRDHENPEDRLEINAMAFRRLDF